MVVVVVVRAFFRFLPEEPVGGYPEVQKAWQAWTFVDFGQKSSVQDGRAGAGGGRCDGLRLHGVWRNSGGGFSARGGRWRLACAYFRGRGACSQYDPKVIVGARALDPKGDAYNYGS